MAKLRKTKPESSWSPTTSLETASPANSEASEAPQVMKKPGRKLRTIKSSAKTGTISRQAAREAVLAVKKDKEAACG